MPAPHSSRLSIPSSIHRSDVFKCRELTMPRQRIPLTTISFTDHAGRPAHSLWGNDASKRPTFSFQVYTTVDLGDGALAVRWPRDLFGDDGGAWRLDVYEQQTDVWACVEHQCRERKWRKQQQLERAGDGALAGRIVESYASQRVIGSKADGFIVVIDRLDWHWRTSDDDGKMQGPLAVWFDTRELAERRVLDRNIDEGYSITEQIEMRTERMPTAVFPNFDLRGVWGAAGMWDWETVEESSAQVESASDGGDNAEVPVAPEKPGIPAGAHITQSETQSGSIVLQMSPRPPGEEGDPMFIYTIYPAFDTPSPLTADDRASIGRAFLAHLLTHLPPASRADTDPEEKGASLPDVCLEMAPQFPSLKECLAHSTAHPREAGYISSHAESPQRRRFPEYGFGATAFQMRYNWSKNKRFIVVLDREDWERNDGVCFVWTEPREAGVGVWAGLGVLVGRVGGGMRGVAERLLGIK